MSERIIALLKENPLVADYRLNTVKTESYEMFFVHRDLETVRSTDTATYKVTVFVEKDGKLGDATFSVYASFDPVDIYFKDGLYYLRGVFEADEMTFEELDKFFSDIADAMGR